MTSPASAKFAASCCSLLIGFTFMGSQLRASDEHLPEKAKAVAQKFEAYKATASPAALELKRKQVVKYLGAILKKEAADANLDRAIAVKELMDEIAGTKPKPKAKPSSPDPKATKANAKAGEVLKLTYFSVKDEASRELEFDFAVGEVRVGGSEKTIRCEIGRAGDDSGDEGLHYQLIDPKGEVAKSGFLSSDTDIVVHKTRHGGAWMLRIKDEDTVFQGEHPGNNGTVRISVTPNGTSPESLDSALARSPAKQ